MMSLRRRGATRLARVGVLALTVAAAVRVAPSPAPGVAADLRPAATTAPAATGSGFWSVGSDGGVFAWDGAPFFGSTGAIHLNQPIVGMAATPDGRGYWLAARDGGVFSFGADARFLGSAAGIATGPVTGLTDTPDGAGYYLVAADNSAYPFGDAGAGGRLPSNAAIVSASTNSSAKNAFGVAPSTQPRFTDGFGSLPPGLGWADGSVHGAWVDQFNGYGTAGITSDGGPALELLPKASASAAETHSALVTSQPVFADLDVTYQLRTARQLRTGSPPNSWEVGWALWHLSDNQHFYYVLLKPDGWELGKEDPAYPGSQRFLATGDSPRFAVGVPHQVRVVQSGAQITVWADGSLLVQFVDQERPYLTGSIGLYCEDSEVHFSSVVVQ